MEKQEIFCYVYAYGLEEGNSSNPTSVSIPNKEALNIHILNYIKEAKKMIFWKRDKNLSEIYIDTQPIFLPYYAQPQDKVPQCLIAIGAIPKHDDYLKHNFLLRQIQTHCKNLSNLNKIPYKIKAIKGFNLNLEDLKKCILT